MRRDAVYVGFILILWAVAIALIGPAGNFPIGDDFAYAKTVVRLVDRHEFKIVDWAAANLLSNVAWGAAFGWIFGANPLVLRVSSLVAGAIGAIAFFRLARLTSAPPIVATIACMLVVFNPLYVPNAFTFMTDTLYLALQLVSMWLLAGGMLRPSAARRGLGWLAGILALLSRQIAIAIPVGVLVEACLRRRPNWRRALGAVVAGALFLVVQKAYGIWIRHAGIAPALYGRSVSQAAAGLHAGFLKTGWHIFFVGYHALHYCGLFALPFTTMYFPVLRRALSPLLWKVAVGILSIWVIGDVLFAARFSMLFPSWDSPFSDHLTVGNWLNTYAGIGDTTSGTPEPRWLAYLMTMLVAAAGALLLLAIAVAGWLWLRREREPFETTMFGLAVAIVLIAPLPLLAVKFDRYFLPVFPCLLLFLLELARHDVPDRRHLIVGGAGAAVLAMLSIGGTHDFMATQRVLWRAYSDLKQSVPAELIDGGVGFNGAESFGKYGSIEDPSSWFRRADFVVSAVRRPGYVPVRRYPVRYWLPWNRHDADVLVQRHRPSPTFTEDHAR